MITNDDYIMGPPEMTISDWSIISDVECDDITCISGIEINNQLFLGTGLEKISGDIFWIRETRKNMGMFYVKADTFYECKLVEHIARLAPSGNELNDYKFNIIRTIVAYKDHLDFEEQIQDINLEQLRREIKINKII